MTLLDKKYSLTINLEDSTVSSPKGMFFFNTDKNVANLYVKIQYRDDVIKYLSKQEAINYKLTLTVIKPKSNNLKEIEGIITNDFEEDYAIYKFELPSEFTDQVGLVVCEFVVTNSTEELTIKSFSYKIEESKVTGLNPEIIPSPDLPVLKQLIKDVKSAQQWITNIDDTKYSEVKTYSSKKIEDIKTNIDEQLDIMVTPYNNEYVSVNFPTIQVEVNNLATSIAKHDEQFISKANKNDLEVQKARIDNLASLAQGSTTGDAELIDGRVGIDGKKYSNIGEAIRKQMKNLTEGKQDIFIAQTTKIDNTYINTVNGSESSSTSWISTDYVDVSDVNKIGYIEIFESSAGIAFYDESKKFISSIVGNGYTFNFKTSTCPSNAKYVRACANKTFVNDVNIWILEKKYAMKNEVENVSKKLDNVIMDSFTHSSNLINSVDLVSITKDCGVTCIKNKDKSFTFVGTPIKDCYIEFSLNCEHISNGKYYLGYNGVIEGIKPSTNYYLWLYNNMGDVSDRLLYINNLSKDTSFIITEEKECTKLRLVFLKDSTININTTHFWLNAETIDSKYKPPYITVNVESSSNSKYENKKANFLGDSITFGMIPDSNMTTQMARPYPIVVKELLGLKECRNYGQSGTCLSVVNENDGAVSNRNNAFVTRMKNMDKDADIIAIFGGVNDYIRSVGGYTNALGTIESVDDKSVYGALNQISKYMIETYPRATIFFITPMKQANTTGVSPYEPKFTLEDVVNAIKKVASINSIPVLDLYNCSGVHFENDIWRAIYGGNDKIHPNQLFVEEHLSVLIANFIKTIC